MTTTCPMTMPALALSRRRAAYGLAVLVASIVFSAIASAEQRREIRFFKINNKDQQTEYRLIKDRRESGCHTLRVARKLYRVHVIGFSQCEVFAKAKCEADASLSFMWQGRKKSRKDVDTSKPQSTLPVGSRWVMYPERMTKFKSWQCKD